MSNKLSTARVAASVVLLVSALVLGACASPSLRFRSVVTASEDPQVREVATRRVPLNDPVVIVTHVSWPESSENGGLHQVRWNWYDGDLLIAERTKTLDFGKPPYRFTRSLPASDLGLGHYRVEVLVDGVKVDEQTFDVVAY